MKAPLRLALIILSVAVAAMLAIGIAVTALFDPEAYRPRIVEAVSQSTGRSFDLDGELGLDLLPCCAVTVGQARLGNPQGFPPADFLAFDSASAHIKLWPLLLRRELEVGTFRIEGLRLNLVRLADGSGNWRFAANAEAPADAGEASTRSGLAGFHMDALEATGAALDYQDLGTGNRYAATDVHLVSGAVGIRAGALAIEAPDAAFTVVGPSLPDGRMALGFSADRVALDPTAGSLDLPAFTLRIDKSTVTGNAAVEPDGSLFVDVSLDRMDLDHYLPRPDDASAAQEETEAEPARIPLEFIRRLDIEGRIHAADLIAFRTHLTDVQANVRAADGTLTLDPLSAKLYRGEFRGRASVDARGDEAVVTLEQTLADVQVGELLQQRLDRQTLEGALAMTMQAVGHGLTSRDVMTTLNGTVTLDLADGVYHGTDFLYQIRRARALLRQETPPPKPASEQTPIQTLAMTGELVNGVLKSDRITAEIPALAVSGKGDFDLLARRVDYRLKAELTGSAEGVDPGELEDLAGHSIPFTVRGPADSPKVTVDLEDLLKDEAVNILQRKLRKLFDR